MLTREEYQKTLDETVVIIKWAIAKTSDRNGNIPKQLQIAISKTYSKLQEMKRNIKP